MQQQTTRREMLIRAGGAAAAVALASGSAQPRLAWAAGDAERGAIWDAHVHLAGVPGSVEERVDRLLEFAGRMGIDRIVLSMGTVFVRDPSPDDLQSANEEVLRAIARAPDRVLGMVYVNPRHQAASLAELDRCVAQGPMVGVKLWIAMTCDRPELDSIVRRATELKAPVLQHTFERVDANLPGESRCTDLVTLAARHPQARFICAHTGADWERSIRIIRPAANIFAEICGSDPTAGFVEMAVRELGAERVLYGSDAAGRSFASQLAKVTSANLPQESQRLILGGNLRRLLEPVLNAKGARA